MQPFDFDTIGSMPDSNGPEDSWLGTNDTLGQEENGQDSNVCTLDDVDDILTPIHDSRNSTLPLTLDELHDLATMDLDSVWPPRTTPQEEQTLTDVAKNWDCLLNEHEANQEDDSTDLGAAKYQFRPHTRVFKRGFNSTWLDEDKTGNYDPTEERREERLRRNRVKFRRRECLGRSANSFDDDDEADGEAAEKVVPTLSVTLRFPSEVGKANLAHVICKLPAKASVNIHGATSGHCLRRRLSGASPKASGDYDVDKPHLVLDLPDDLTGHPIARGCWACLGLGICCSLLENEHSWPCAACLDDDQDCNLVTPPKLKRACECCKRRRCACSYTHSLNHSGPCQQCGDDGYKCVAGPVKEAVPTRIRYERDWQNHPMPKKRVPKIRKILTCTECRKAGRQCSFSTVDSSPACAACKEAGSDKSCAVDIILPQRHGPAKRRKTKGESEINSLLVSLSPLAKAANATQDSEGIVRKIQTKFCHPISFNHEDNTAGSESCHFCAEAGYAIFGLEAREVEVIDWADGRNLEEISGGHRGKGVENTRMCPDCTLSRLTIMMCPAHELGPIAGVKKDALDMNTALAELLSGDSKVSGRWCSICPSLALYECCSASEEGEGCSFSLCEACMVPLVGQYDGDLQKMIAEMKDEPTEERMLGLRADYELLKQDGLLMRYVLWSSQQ